MARIAHLVATDVIQPSEVLAISFTNQAAKELEERLVESLGIRFDEKPLVTTFHGFGLSVLKEFGEGNRILIICPQRRGRL